MKDLHDMFDFDDALMNMAKQVHGTKERVLEELATAGIDPRIIRFDVEYRTEERDGLYFLSAIVSPRVIS